MAALVAARIGRAITPRLAARLRDPHRRRPVLRCGAGTGPRSARRVARGRGGGLRACARRGHRPRRGASGAAGSCDRKAARGGGGDRSLGSSGARRARASGIGQADAEHAVAQALSERLVDEVPATRPTVAFPHALIREALARRARRAPPDPGCTWRSPARWRMSQVPSPPSWRVTTALPSPWPAPSPRSRRTGAAALTSSRGTRSRAGRRPPAQRSRSDRAGGSERARIVAAGAWRAGAARRRSAPGTRGFPGRG